MIPPGEGLPFVDRCITTGSLKYCVRFLTVYDAPSTELIRNVCTNILARFWNCLPSSFLAELAAVVVIVEFKDDLHRGGKLQALKTLEV